MKILIPVEPDEVILTTSIGADISDYPVWAASTSFVPGDRIYANDGSLSYDFEAVAANTNVNPITDQLSADPKWVNIGLSNRYKVMDRVLGQSAKGTTGAMTYRFEMTENVTAVALFGLVGQTVKVSVETFDGMTYTTIPGTLQERQIASSPAIKNWFEYFFNKYTMIPDMIFTGLPGYTGNFLRIDITSTLDVEIGEIVFGQEMEVGVTLEKPSLGIRDYSRKERDEFGRPVIIERPFSIYGDFNIVYPSDQTRSLLTELAKIRAKPCVFYVEGLTDGAGTMIFGYYTDFSANLEIGAESFASITVEGLV